jgi:RHS repeat-associated protein
LRSEQKTAFSIGYDFHAGNGTANSGTDNGNVYGIINYKDTTHGRDQTFTYDLLNRVISAQNAGTNCSAMVLQNKTEYWGNSYSYDAWGNLLQKNVTKCGAENLSVTADAHNWIHASGTDYQYDAAGNMTYDATASLSYTFDQENRLTGAAGYTYTYDGDGNRVRKSNGNLAANGTLYWYMMPGVVAESDLAGTLKSEYVFFDGERVARRDGATGAGGVFYYFSDHLKTASVITDSAGVIKAESDYYPWGGELQFVNNDSNDYKFTGKKRDIETGLDYFGARYYSNGLGRWVSADWSAMPVPVPYADFGDPQSLNQYSYVRNLPTTRIDADGHCCAPYELADKVDAWINMSVKATQDRAPSMNPVAAAGDVFVTGSAGDLVKGFTNLLRIGESAGSLPEGSGTTDKIIAGAEEGGRVGGIILAVVGVAGPKGEVGANAGESGTSAGTGGRLPQDINVNPQAPAANSGNGKVGPSATQNAAAQGDAAAAKAAGHTDIRMNQQQVNASGVRVGKNRPDLQSTDPKGVRHYTEYDRNAQNAAAHHARTKANDPNGVTHTNVGP